MSNRPEVRTAPVAQEILRYKVEIAKLSGTWFSKQGQIEEVDADYAIVWHLNFSILLAQRLNNLPVAAAAANDERALVENRWCYLRDKVQSAALAVLRHARRQHQDLFDDNDAAMGNLLAGKSRLHKDYVDRPTDNNRAAFLLC
ncbi:hypothetical protein SprV_0802561500 [Sparganum proliferum]